MKRKKWVRNIFHWIFDPQLDYHIYGILNWLFIRYIWAIGTINQILIKPKTLIPKPLKSYPLGRRIINCV